MGSYMKHISNAFLAQVIVYQDIQGGKPCDKRDIVVVSPRQSESVAFRETGIKTFPSSLLSTCRDGKGSIWPLTRQLYK